MLTYIKNKNAFNNYLIQINLIQRSFENERESEKFFIILKDSKFTLNLSKSKSDLLHNYKIRCIQMTNL